MIRTRPISRRQWLRGAGVALALPLLPSLRPRQARAQALQPPTRYVALYFPNGTAAYWRPATEGSGDQWQLSPILQPLAPVKPYVQVLTNVANYSPFGGHVEPSHSNCCASTWTSVRPGGAGNNENGVSVDQVIAKHVGGDTPLESIQVGLSTLNSFEDGLPGQHSRSISWRSASEPLYKIVNPQALFDRLTGTGLRGDTSSQVDASAAQQRRALQQSVLDAVLGDANALHTKLGARDRERLDQFMTSVRALERRIDGFSMGQTMPSACQIPQRPDATYAVDNVPPGYDRDVHAGLMIDLVAMALRCDITRVVSFMLDDARSDFVYDFLTERVFSETGSEAGNGRVAGYHGLQHAGDTNNGFASIGHWNAQKAAQLAGRLAEVDQGDGSNLLDHSTIVFCSGMNGGNHDAGMLPVALIGGGGRGPTGRALKQDRHVVFSQEQSLADVHLTLLQQVHGCPETRFGTSSGIIDDLLAR